MPTYRGRCHCGAIAFEAEGELVDLEICNCSICAMTGYVHWFVPPEKFRLTTSKEAIVTYRFGTMTAEHPFCRTCGISPFRKARSDPDKVDVNLRCLEGVDFSALETREFDGLHWEDAYRRLRPGMKRK